MKKNAVLLMLAGFALFACENAEPVVNRQDAVVEKNAAAVSEDLRQWIQADANKRIAAILNERKSPVAGRLSSDCGYAYCTSINYQQGGSTNCTLNITTARNTAVPPFSTLCAAPSNFRYGIIYFGSAAQGAVYGPTGGCLGGSLTYTINGTQSYSSQPSYVLVYNVFNGPGGGATFVGHVSGNSVLTQCQ